MADSTGTTINDVTASLGRLNSQVEKLSGVTTQAQAGMRNWPMFFMQLGFAAEDANYGIHSAANNLGMMAMALAPGSPWTVGVQVAAAGLTTLVMQWDRLSDAFTTKRPFPKLGSELELLKRQLGEATAALEKLQQAGTGGSIEQAQFAKALQRQAEAQRRISDIEFAQSEKDIVETVGSKNTEARAAVARTAIQEAGGGRIVSNQLQTAGLSELQANMAVASALRGGVVTDALAKVLPGLRKQFEDAVSPQAQANTRLQREISAQEEVDRERRAGVAADTIAVKREQRTLEFGQMGADTSSAALVEQELNAEAQRLKTEYGLLPSQVDKLVRDELRAVTEGFSRSVETVASDYGVTLEEAGRIVVRRMEESRAEAQRNLRDEELRNKTGQTLAESEAAQASRNARRLAETQDQIGATGGAEMAASFMWNAVNNPMFRQQSGASTRMDALTRAADMAREEIATRAQMSPMAGGMGLNRDAAYRYAIESVSQAFPGMSQMIEQAQMVDPQTAKEMAAQTKELVMANRQLLERGLKINWAD